MTTLFANSAITRALETLNGAAAELRDLQARHQNAVAEARLNISKDRNLTEEGRANRLRETTAALGEQNLAALKALRARIEAAQNAITNVVESAWPKPAAGVEGMLGRQAAWARSRSLLEGGIAVADVIQEATDTETLYALRDELPTWVRARGGNSEVMEQVRARIDQRIARLASDAAAVDLTAKYEARAIVAGLGPLLDHAEAVVSGQRPADTALGAAVAGRMARQVAYGTQGPIIGPDGNAL
ncbi:hypothetical protein [Streptomyces luteogriseus]|uniref:hypothetical protein n=1 Tax=Streptomyces luteogriseus TaxID=68233 RepID=UPI0037A0AD66